MGLIDKIKLRPQAAAMSDALLADMIADCEAEVRAHCNLPESEPLSPLAEVVVKDLVIYRLNRIGSEGLTVEQHSGNNRLEFTDGIPKELQKKLARFRRLP